MKEQVDKVNEAAHKLAQTMYSQSQEQGETSEGSETSEGGETSEGTDADSGNDKKSDDDVVDAEFEDVGKK